MKDLKPLPYSTTKQDLVTMYLDQMSEKQIRKAINEIIKDFAKTQKNTTGVHNKNIPHVIFMEFVETYGAPKGYVENQTNF